MFSDRVNPFEPIKNRQDLGQNVFDADQSTSNQQLVPNSNAEKLDKGFFSTISNLDNTVSVKDLDFKFLLRFAVQNTLSKFIPSIPPVFSTQENKFATRNEIKSNFNKLM